MAATYLLEGQTIPFTPAGDVAKGSVVITGNLVGIANRAISAGIEGVLHISGIFIIDKNPAQSFATGDIVYWDAIGGYGTKTDTGVNFGIAVADSDDSFHRLRVSLDAIKTVGGGGGGSSAWGGITGTLSDQSDLQSELDGKVNVNNGVHTGNTDLGTGAWAASSFYVGAGSNRTYIDGVYGLIGVLGGYVKIKNGINIQGSSQAFVLQSILKSEVINYVSSVDYKTRLTGTVADGGVERKWIEVDSIVGAAIIKLFGAITTDDTINGRDIATDGAKLDTIEANAKDDQTGAEIKALYELEPGAYTDTKDTKLNGIETGATADQTGAEIKSLYEAEANTNAFTDALKSKLESIDAAHYGAPLQTTVQLSALTEASLTDKERRYVEDELSDYFYDSTAVSGDIAPDDQTGGTGFWKKVAVGGETPASIKTKYESNADTNAFTDAEKTKLSNIETNAKDDQNASEVPFTPNGDITSSDVQAAIVEVRDDTDTKLSGKSNTGHGHTAADISDFDTEVSNNASVAANTAKVSADGSISTHSDVDLTGIVADDILKWNGSSFVPAQESGGSGGSPLTNNTVQQVTATATTSIDLANGHVILMKHNVNIDQISFANQPTVGEWILIRKSGTSTSIDFNNSIGWPSDIFFDNGTAPTFTAAEQVAWKFIKAGTDDKIRAYEIFRYEVGEQELMIGKNDAPLYKRVRVGTWADHSSLSGGASAYAYHMKYAPNNTYFVWSSNSSSYLHLYDSEPLSGVMSNLGITGIVSTPHYNIAWYPDSTYYIVGISASPYMKKYLVSGGASSETVGGTAPASACLGVAFSPDGSYFAASFNSSPYLRVWNVVDPTDMSTWTDVTLGASLSGTGTSALAFSPDGSELVAGIGSTSPYFERYDTSTWAKKSNPASLPGTAVWGAVYSNDGSLLCLATAGAGTERLVVYDRSDMSKVTITGGQPAGGEAYAIDITPDDKYLAIGHNSGGYVTIYNVSDWTTVSHGMSFTGYPRTLAFSNLFLQG